MRATVLTDGLLHRFILLDARLAERLPDAQDLADDRMEMAILQSLGHAGLREPRELHPVHAQPSLELLDAVRVLEPRKLLCLGHELLRHLRVEIDGTLDELAVDADAAAIDSPVDEPEPMLLLAWLEPEQTAADLPFRHDILAVVLLKDVPIFWRIVGQVPRPAAVLLRRSAGLAEIRDETLAPRVLHLVLWQPQRLAYSAKRRRQGMI